jgi:hypothetical protein
MAFSNKEKREIIRMRKRYMEKYHIGYYKADKKARQTIRMKKRRSKK